MTLKNFSNLCMTLWFVFSTLTCTTLPEQGLVDIYQREKEISRYPNLNSLIIFPSTGDVNKSGEISHLIQKEIIRQLGSAAGTLGTAEQIFSDWNAREIFFLAIQPQLLFFNDFLKEKDFQMISKQNIIRYPGIEYLHNDKLDTRLTIRQLSFETKNMESLVASINDLDYQISKELLSSIPRINSSLIRLSQEALKLIDPTYLIFTRIEGDEKSYKKEVPLSITAIIVNFQTGAIRSAGRIKSLPENFKVPYKTQIKNLTAILLKRMEKSGFNLPQIF